MPSVRRPPESWLTVSACLAVWTALRRSGPSITLVISSIRSVTAAAAASAMSGSQLPYTIRSIVPRLLNPCASARLANPVS